MKQRTASWASLLLGFMSVTSHAQDNATWIEDAHGCKFLHPQPEKGPLPQPLQWDGACVDGYLSGPGTASLGVQAVYTGEFKRGVMDSGEVKYRSVAYKGALKRNSPNGHGVWTYPNGWVVEGEVGADFALIGVVDIKLPDGTHYRGGVKEMGRGEIHKHGRGKLVGANGNVYEGDFQFDQFHGQGRTTYAAGGSYVGQWAFGQYEGKGVYEGADGSRYEGDFRRGKVHGEVTMRNADGSVYVGQCVAGDRQGKGRMQYADGTVFEGEWKGDKLNGACTLKSATGTSYVGECVNSERSGRGHFEDPGSGLVYDGEYRNNRYHGQGKYKEPGYVYEGSFAAGVRSGRGKEVFEHGEQYEGEFSQNLRQGRGLLRLAVSESTSVTYEGEFAAGRFVRGRVVDATGRTIEIDVQAGTVIEIRPDGTKIPLNETEMRSLEVI